MKRGFFTFLITVLFLTSLSTEAIATSNEIFASFTLTGYSAGLSSGETDGTVNVSYDIRASKLADSIGVSSIKIYKSDGSYVTTILGTTDNGLIREDSSIHKSVYSVELTSGNTYYAVVNIFATVGSRSDSREITTKSISI